MKWIFIIDARSTTSHLQHLYSCLSSQQIFQFTVKMLSPLFTFSPKFSRAGKDLIREAASLAWKLMSQQRDVSAAFLQPEAPQTTWLIPCVLTLWLMIGVCWWPTSMWTIISQLRVILLVSAFSGVASLLQLLKKGGKKKSHPQIHVTVIKKRLWKGGEALPRDQLKLKEEGP